MNSRNLLLISLSLLGLVSCGTGLDLDSGNGSSSGYQLPSGASMILDAASLAGAGSACASTTITDSSGNGKNGTLNCASGGGFYGTGTSSDPYRINFNGTSTYISTALNAQSNTMTSTTWLVWVKPSNTTFSHVLSIDNHGGAFNRSLVIDNSSSNWGAFRPSTTWNSGQSVTTSAWQFVAIQFTASDIYLYKGSNVTSYGSAPGYTVTANNFTIGRSGGGAFDYFTGDIGWLAVYPSALSSTEIYNACMSLVSRYPGASCN